jgi:hypothetical protein
VKRTWIAAAALFAAHAACSFGRSTFDPGGTGDAGALSDQCQVSLGYVPTEPVAAPGTGVEVNATTLHATGPLTYTWQVVFEGHPVRFSTGPGRSIIDFVAENPGVYEVSVDIAGADCSRASTMINVRAPGASSQTMRLRVLAPVTSPAPPYEKLVVIKGGAAAYLGLYNLDLGEPTDLMVLGPAGGVPAYLRFTPNLSPDTFVEAFSNATGSATERFLPGVYAVMAVPSVAGLAPSRAKSWVPGQLLRVDAGQAVTGTVRDPKNALLAGATVQLTLDGVPSTVATTAADGSFALRAAVPTSAVPVTVDVVPPAASGLPRLTATSQSFNLGMPLQIRYTSAPAPVDLGGTAVQRPDQSRIAGARVTVVGTLAAAGTITAGTSVTATGDVRITAAADAGGTLLARLVPVAPLSSVIEDGTGVLAVVALDTTAGVPARLTVPPLVAAPIMVSGADAAAAPGATLDLVPTGALGMASTVTLHFVADATGALQPPPRLPPGGHYELRLADPLARFAPLFIADRAVEAIAPSYQLSTGVRLGGVVQRANVPLGGASVQILCNDCTGIAHDKPLVEVVSDAVGQFTLVMPDPGTR